MPIYVHACKQCGHRMEEFRPLADYANEPDCPMCGIPMPQTYTDQQVRGDYKKPVLMQSMGFPADPSEVAEHRRLYPNVDLEFQQGHAIPVMRSLNQKRAYLKANGWADLRSF